MKQVIFLLLLYIVSGAHNLVGQSPQEQTMLTKINTLRSKGCVCQDRYMAPVEPLTWSATLLTSAVRHAEDMKKNNYFSHFSPTGQDIGDRIDAVGYSWSYCGENLGSGQRNFDEVMEDWIRSKSHCMMLMNPEVEEVAVAKIGTYWVQHFGKRFDQELLRSN